MTDAAVPATLSSELLGFPPDARVLIVNNDDLGMYHAINDAVIQSIEEGISSSCSLMVPCPAAPHAMELLRDRPEISFGIHFTLVCDSPGYRWGPVVPKAKIRSLLDDNGELFTNDRRTQLLAQARIDEVELELRAQVSVAIDAGLAPVHLDWHCLADGGRDDILDLTLELAEEYGLAARVWLDRGRAKARQHGWPVVDHPFLDSYSIDTEGKSARYAELLRGLPAGLSEWAVHPSLGDEASQAIDDGWPVRRADFEFLTSPTAREIVEQEGIVVINYRSIQEVWATRD
ncbi:MAG TPA: polysaccharide deacetylase family protein [Mycobacteriales bacterium]|nr:polysaccharide deacetylase family protein [Mycobacteriales bacterium]